MTLFIPLIFILQFILSIIYYLGSLRLMSGLSRLKYDENQKNEQPAVSIIISLHNEEKNIPALIAHLALQDYPKNLLEIIFVDDRSNDSSFELLDKDNIGGFPVRLIRIEKTAPDFAPKKYAITQAVAQARGEILLFTDADGRPGPKWVSRITSLFNLETGMVLGYAPYTTENLNDGILFRILALEYLSHAAVSAASAGLNYPVTCVGTNMAYRKIVFEQLSGYGKFSHIHTGDDDLFLQRVRDETNWHIRYATDKESRVDNAPPENFRQFYNQRLRYASKGFLYPPVFKILLIGFYLFNFLFLLNSVFALIFPLLIPVCMLALLLKFISDYMFIFRAASVLHDRRHLSLIFIALIIHIPYVVYFGLAAQLQNFIWAGRRG